MMMHVGFSSSFFFFFDENLCVEDFESQLNYIQINKSNIGGLGTISTKLGFYFYVSINIIFVSKFILFLKGGPSNFNTYIHTYIHIY